jgi:two-component system NtrC family sensor kinase
MISLRTRLTGAFTLVVVGGTAVSTLIGSRIITRALLDEVRSRAVQGVNAAQTMYADEQASTLAAVRRAARPPLDLTAAHAPLDFVNVVTAAAEQQDPCLDTASFRQFIDAARTRETAATEVLSAACLAATGSTARSGASPALALVGAVPVQLNARTRAVVYGGIILNGRRNLVDAIKLLVYGNGTFRGREVGSASVFLNDTRIATTAEGADGADGYVTATRPIRNFAGEVVGTLHVGTLEAPILAVRTRVMLTFFVVCAFGLVVVFAMTYLITRRTISPLETMAAATKEIAAGDLGVRVSVNADNEIGELAGAFNAMLSSLETMNREREEWGHTLEDKVRERTDQLVAVQADMARAQKLASIGRLAAGVAHSINNPLGGILSLSMLAAEDCKDPTLLADLKTIATQAMRCREIVKGLLEFSHQSDARVAETDVNAIVGDSVELLERQSAFHNITIVRRLADGLAPVLVNPGQLQDAVTNLLVNAVDAMERGGTLTVETATDGAPDRVLIRIADTGCGIPEEHMPYLFEPFFTTKRVGKGTGLGLATTHGVVTKARGTIEVASSTRGTTFTIHLPAVPAASRLERDVELAGTGTRESAVGG